MMKISLKHLAKWNGNFFKKNGPTPAFFCLFSVFSNKNYKFLLQIYVKNVRPVYGTGIWTHDLRNMTLLP